MNDQYYSIPHFVLLVYVLQTIGGNKKLQEYQTFGMPKLALLSVSA